jgi:hypothetical protein
MTFGYALLVALFWALIISLVFISFSGRNWPRQDAGWSGALYFFLIVWLATWGIGMWLAPTGPVLWGVPWLWFLFLAIIFSLLLAASSPPPRRPRTRAEAIVQASEEAAEDEAVAVMFGMYFWILLVVLIVVLLARYMWFHPTPLV